MLTYRPFLFGGALLLLGLATLIMRQDVIFDTDPPVLLTTNTWPGYEPIYLARSRGRIDPGLATLVEFPSSYDSIRALRTRAAGAAMLTLDEALTLAAESADYRIVLVADISCGADTLLARPGITSLAGLKGRRVAVNGGAVGAYMLTRALMKAGMEPGDIVITQASEAQHEELWDKGEIDALVTFEPARSRLLAKGARELFTSRDIPGEIVDVLVVHKNLLGERRDKLRRLVGIWYDQVDDMRRHPAETQAAIGVRLGLSPQATASIYDGLRFTDRAEARNLMTDGTLRATAERLGAIMLSRKLVAAPPRIGTLLDASLLEESAE